MSHLFSIICLFVIYNGYVNCDLAITLKQGRLIGKLVTNEYGQDYYSYSGIPYAKPPVGELRFKPPMKAEPWKGVLNATETGNVCRAFNFLSKKLEGDEDCLFLNIYVPTTPSDKPIPVFFWIHGGGFIGGSGNPDFHGADYLLGNGEIILVTINYRLGVLGFLNLQLEGAPGNVGLKDQVEALKWTKENIAKFGGDPENITIGGSSAGGASVHYLLLSHTTSGLFQKAIAESGSAFNPWALQRHPLKRASQICDALNYSANSTEDALEFLLKVPVDLLLTAKLPPEVENLLIDDFKFVPSIEKVFPSHEPFLEESALDRMKSGTFNKVPLMIGFNSAEGISYKFFEQFSGNKSFLMQMEDDYEKSVPLDLEIPRGSETSKKLGEKIIQFYFEGNPVTENEQKFVDLVGDDWFIRGIDKHVKLTVEKQTDPVYYYEYSFDEYSPVKEIMGDHNLTGASHVDGTSNIFKADILPLKKDKPNVLLIQKRMLAMFTNFIKTGNPTPEVTELLPVRWEPATKEKLYYLNIDVNLTMETNPEDDRMKFWENLNTQNAAEN